MIITKEVEIFDSTDFCNEEFTAHDEDKKCCFLHEGYLVDQSFCILFDKNLKDKRPLCGVSIKCNQCKKIYKKATNTTL